MIKQWNFQTDIPQKYRLFKKKKKKLHYYGRFSHTMFNPIFKFLINQLLSWNSVSEAFPGILGSALEKSLYCI